jgi:hypothetical protein
MTSTRASARLAALAALTVAAALPATASLAGAQTFPQPNPSPTYTNGGPQQLPAPVRMSRDGSTRPLTRSELARLQARGGSSPALAPCQVDFDDQDVLAWTDGALDFFSGSWNQDCNDGTATYVIPVKWGHMHLGYIDPEIEPCQDPDNPNDHPFLSHARGEDCEFIDPYTEPRSHIMVHLGSEQLRIDRRTHADSDATFDLIYLRVKGQPADVCFQVPAEGPWYTTDPVGPFDEPGLSYCWMNLAPGYYDFDRWVNDVTSVNMTSNAGNIFGVDDITTA